MTTSRVDAAPSSSSRNPSEARLVQAKASGSNSTRAVNNNKGKKLKPVLKNKESAVGKEKSDIKINSWAINPKKHRGRRQVTIRKGTRASASGPSAENISTDKEHDDDGRSERKLAKSAANDEKEGL